MPRDPNGSPDAYRRRHNGPDDDDELRASPTTARRDGRKREGYRRARASPHTAAAEGEREQDRYDAERRRRRRERRRAEGERDQGHRDRDAERAVGNNSSSSSSNKHASTSSTADLVPREQREEGTKRRAGYYADSPGRRGSPRTKKEGREREDRRGYRRGAEDSETTRRARREEHRRRRREDEAHKERGGAARGGLSAEGLAKLDAMNRELGGQEEEVYTPRKERRIGTQKEEIRSEKGPDVYDEYLRKERREDIDYRRTGRVVSGTKLEKGTGGTEKIAWWRRAGTVVSGVGTYSSEAEERRMRKRRKRTCYVLGAVLLILVIAIPVGVVVSCKESGASSTGSSTTSGGAPSNSNLDGVDPNSVPQGAKGTWTDPFSWYDTTDFNVTYTSETVGGLPVIGLNSTWDDSTRANDRVPGLDQKWAYGTMPIRGINVGGWFVLEPLITPSFFSKFKSSDGVVDEWTLTAKLAAQSAKTTLETHYAGFIVESDFQQMQSAGFDHVRIPFGYWAIATYGSDPYVAQVSWRYLLRAIEWCRKYGLRVNLDLHGAPGSQNGWNHSGRQGSINWLNGTDGALNGQRTIDLHDQLSKFFAAPRYRNIITIYGLVNEPKMTVLDTSTVTTWTQNAVAKIRANGINATIAFGDGFLGLDNWQGKLQGIPGLVLDVHQYVIFNTAQLVLNHHDKVNFACGGWTAQALRSQDKTTGFGPTLFAEWSQADTDCAPYLNNVGIGSRWEGTLNFASSYGGGGATNVLTATCPTGNNPRCSCKETQVDPAQYSSAYKAWLLDFALAQMDSFEKGWGWFYWTWKTEAAGQWSWQKGLEVGTLPQKTWDRTWSCNQTIRDYAGMGLPEYY